MAKDIEMRDRPEVDKDIDMTPAEGVIDASSFPQTNEDGVREDDPLSGEFTVRY